MKTNCNAMIVVIVTLFAVASSTNANAQNLNPFDKHSDVRKALDSWDNGRMKNDVIFRPAGAPPRPYVLQNVATGKLLSLPVVAGNPDGAHLHGWADKGQRNQHWFVIGGPNGTKAFVNVMQDKFVDLAVMAGNPNGAVIHGFRHNGQPNQLWVMEPTGRDTMRLRNVALGKYLNLLPAQHNADGARIVGWDPNGQANQEWRLLPVR